MSDSPQDFDLKFLPDWLKEGPSTNRYADFEGESDRPRRDRDDRGPRPPGRGGPDRRGPRPGGPGGAPGGRRPDGPRPGGGPRSDRPGGNRPGGPGGPGGPRRDDRRGPGGSGGGRPFDRRGDDRRDQRPPREAPRPAPAELRVEFLPEPNAGNGIARQIKSGTRAYAVFATAKLFLERPERHRVRVASQKPDVLLYQIGDGPIAFDAATVDRGAFLQMRDEFYAEETTQGEPIKGNFSNVARVRGTGILLGPTNHHSYQPGLRKIYEERFSRRMSFPEFQQYEIEIVSDEQTVADWKEQARNTTTYTTKKEAEPIVFKTLFDAEQHFRKTYLPTLVKSGPTLECDGVASRVPADRHVSNAVRQAWESERAFPQGLVNALRPYFSEAGLHFFKHRKRVLHVSPIKPVRHPENQPFSDGINAVLKTIEGRPRIKRPELATKILGEGHDAPEAAPRKEQLAADLHYLLHIGYVIEFADGSFDLPLGPKPEQPEPTPKKEKKSPVAEQPKGDLAVPTTAAALTEEAAPGASNESGADDAVDATAEASALAAEAYPETGGEAAPPVEEAPSPSEVENEADPREATAQMSAEVVENTPAPEPPPTSQVPAEPVAPAPGHA